MLARPRNWILRTSIFINAVVLLYFASYITTRNGDLGEDMQIQPLFIIRNATNTQDATNKEISSAIGAANPPGASSSDEYQQQEQSQSQPQQDPSSPPSGSQPQLQGTAEIVGANAVAESFDASLPQQPLANTVNSQGTTSDDQNNINNNNSNNNKPGKISTTLKSSDMGDSASGGANIGAATPEATEPTTLKEIVQCNDKSNEFRISQKGDFWVLNNYVVPPNRTFRCYETITYTTHADYTFIDNLEPLVERWQGPVSLAMYAPGTDFGATLNTIRYLRKCGSPAVTEFVTFHLYFGSKFVPKVIPKPDRVLDAPINCSAPAPWVNVSSSYLYKTQKKLLYPVNVGRNIARDNAVTYYILASDIELYPSPGIIPDFMEMIRRQDPPLLHKKPKVFPLALFEVESNLSPPASKSELVEMLNNHTAIPFHKKVCPGCHNFPKSKEWISAPIKSGGVRVFHIGKRLGYFVHWEPIFIGTHSDPYYDERLSWEGKSDKMTQGYALCVLDYEFQILDNAFLVHKPGIKTLKKDTARAILTGRTNTLIRKVIFPELKVLYGTRKGCAV